MEWGVRIHLQLAIPLHLGVICMSRSQLALHSDSARGLCNSSILPLVWEHYRTRAALANVVQKSLP